MGTKIVSEEEFNKITGPSDMATALVGKPVTLKFTGREYVNNEGATKTATDLGFLYFAERADANPSRLSYDPNNEYDFKRLPNSGTTAAAPAETPADDLPF
jgi:hypothetical protein